MGIAAVLLVYLLFIYGLSSNPPGFYVDEACLAYNGYAIAHIGFSESGDRYPLFVQCFAEPNIQWASPVHVYLLAALYLVVPPSTLSARLLAATMVFLASLLLGLLAVRISGKKLVGVIIALTALTTPWLFETSRLVLETFFFPLAIGLFLLCLYNATRREKWKISDILLLAISLALITYSYTVGRLIGTGLAFGLIIFANNRQALFGVLKTWAAFAVTLLPFVYIYLTNGKAVMGRFEEVGYFNARTTWWEIVTQFLGGFFAELNPYFLLVQGDTLLRHHVQGMGEIFVATFILVIASVVILVTRHRSNPWWRFILYGLAVSVLPGALTVTRHHSQRLIAFPVFFLVLTIPALMWLVGGGAESPVSNALTRRVIVIGLMVLTIAQAALFQWQFWTAGMDRKWYFDGDYPRLVDAALENGTTPIYLVNGAAGPSYIYALWYGAIRGVDASNFIHLKKDEVVPPGATAINSDKKCSRCKVLAKDSDHTAFIALDNSKDPVGLERAVSDVSLVSDGSFTGTGEGKLYRPRGIATDKRGNVYIADTENARIQKYDGDMNFIATFGTKGSGPGQLDRPSGIAVDDTGAIYVDDNGNQTLVKFAADGSYVKEWRDLGIYGPRDMALGPNNHLYIVNSGPLQIVNFDPATETKTAWGKVGDEEGDFFQPTGIAVGDNLVFVTDFGNNRIQAFDLEGQFVRQWAVDVWGDTPTHLPDIVFDEESKYLFVTNGNRNEILAFDINGRVLTEMFTEAESALDFPSSLAISTTNGQRRLFVMNANNGVVSKFAIAAKNAK